MLSEIHQFSVILIELKEATTIGISHLPETGLNCFSVNKALRISERTQLVNDFYAGKTPNSATPLTMEQFLKAVEGKKPRHIWLETGGRQRKELGFMSITELKAHFRIHSRRQH
jgi:hypothetical protein